jgi:hypothetical protein
MGGRVVEGTGGNEPKFEIAAVQIARIRGDFRESERLLREEIGRAPRPALSRSLARLFEELERPNDALPLWFDLRQEHMDFEACYHISRTRMEAGSSAADAVTQSAPGASAVFRTRLVRALTKPVAVAASHAGVRHIAICGDSYCGSTILDRMLGSLPAVASIGESHWLTRARPPAHLREADVEPIDFNDERPQWVPQCTFCGNACPAITLDFRADLAADHKDWYPRIAQRLAASILVSSDKNWRKLVDNDPLLRLDALVLFKSPEQAWRSKRARLPAGESPEFYEAKLMRHLRSWWRAYSVYLADFRPTGTVQYVWFDEFALRRGAGFQLLCELLDLPYDANVVRRIRPGHSLEGNDATVARLHDDKLALDILPLPAPDFPAREREIIEANETVQSLFNSMLERRMKL